MRSSKDEGQRQRRVGLTSGEDHPFRPANLPEGWKPPSSITENMFITEVRDVPQAIEHLKMLTDIKPCS